MMESRGNILFSGVGGQGILLASEITALGLLGAGFDVKKSEVHGMAQRGGSVTAQLRYGKKVYSPLIEPGCADIQVAFEMMEAVRYLPYLHKGSKVCIDGKIKTRKYQGKDGGDRYITEVIANELHFLDSKRDDDSGAPRQNTSRHVSQNVADRAPGDDIPF